MLHNINPDRQTRVLAIHDISCLGKCSVTAVLPILSAAGIETAVIPTAILSTHTGGFTGYTFRDLTDDIMPIIEHWEREGIDFDAVYTGYLGSFRQINIMKDIFTLYKAKGAMIAVDPVMGDNGRLYSGIEETFPCGMRELCQMADIITPNITEACLMLGLEYREPPYDEAFIEGLINGLRKICDASIVLTGVSLEEGIVGAATYDNANNEISYAFAPREKGMFHGTGDVFASALLASVMNGNDIRRSAEVAVAMVTDSIKKTVAFKHPTVYGVNFEVALPDFIKNI